MSLWGTVEQAVEEGCMAFLRSLYFHLMDFPLLNLRRWGGVAGGVDPSAGTRGKCSIFADWVCCEVPSTKVEKSVLLCLPII